MFHVNLGTVRHNQPINVDTLKGDLLPFFIWFSFSFLKQNKHGYMSTTTARSPSPPFSWTLAFELWGNGIKGSDLCLTPWLTMFFSECISKSDLTRNVIGFMKHNGCHPSVMNYSALVNGLCKVVKLQDAKGVFAEMKSYVLKPYMFRFRL